MTKHEGLRNLDQVSPGNSLGIYLADGAGGGRTLGWQEIPEQLPEGGFLWFHLDRTDPEHQDWLKRDSGLDELTVEILLEEGTRPRLASTGDDLIAILRGVNLNPDPDDDLMISLRVLCQPRRIISLRRARLYSVGDIRDLLLAGRGPKTTGDFLIELTELLVDRQIGVIGELAEEVDEIEETILDAEGRELRSRLAAMRRKAISLRRYIAPQREVLARLQQDRSPVLDDRNRIHAREVAEAQTRLIEELDATRDRAALAQEELSGRLADQMNRNMYLLSIIAGIFLPLGLLTGLLGINVGGMPGTDSDMAFTVVCVILFVMAGICLWIFRRLRII